MKRDPSPFDYDGTDIPHRGGREVLGLPPPVVAHELDTNLVVDQNSLNLIVNDPSEANCAMCKGRGFYGIPGGPCSFCRGSGKVQWRSTSQPEQFRKCEFCGCNTNAKVRACCEKGKASDGMSDSDRQTPEPTP